MFYIGFGVGVLLGCMTTIIFLAISKELVKEKKAEENLSVCLKQHTNNGRMGDNPSSLISH